MELKEAFEKAVTDSKQLPSKPSNDILLKLYSLFKQATQGDAAGESPSNPFDFVGKAKFEAWAEQKGKSAATAMQEYIDQIAALKG